MRLWEGLASLRSNLLTRNFSTSMVAMVTGIRKTKTSERDGDAMMVAKYLTHQ